MCFGLVEYMIIGFGSILIMCRYIGICFCTCVSHGVNMGESIGAHLNLNGPKITRKAKNRLATISIQWDMFLLKSSTEGD